MSPTSFQKMCIRDSAYTDVSTGKLILSAAAPVYDPSGKNIVGVAGLDIALDLSLIHI